MDITLYKLGQIIELLEKIEENTRPDPEPSYVWNGIIHLDTHTHTPGGIPDESIARETYPLDELNDEN